MSFRSVILATAVLASGLVQAEVLYWQVANDVTVNEYGGGSHMAQLGSDYTYARLVYGTDSSLYADPTGYIGAYVLGGSVSDAAEYVDMVAVDGATLLGSIDGSESYFWLELYTSTGEKIGRSNAVTGSDLNSFVHDPASFTPQDLNQSTWVVDSVTATAVPEPTSGLLLLFGVASLALRRRRFC